MTKKKTVITAADISHADLIIFNIVDEYIKDIKLREIAFSPLLKMDFRFYPASLKWHHDHIGGLMIHTSEVLQCAVQMAKTDIIDVDMNTIILSAIWHDYGKIWDYTTFNEVALKNMISILHDNGEIVMDSGMQFRLENIFEYADHRNKIRHLARSYHEFLKEVDRIYKNEKPPIDLDAISHCILAHHGRVEWNSPVEPQTPEAYILHFADMLSAKGCKNRFKK